MPSLYLETSIVSYLTARPSSNIITAAHQLITHEWWARRRLDFELATSAVVVQEAARGDEVAAAKRLRALAEIPVLALEPEAAELAARIVEKQALTPRAYADALHIAIASHHQMNFLLTWNCTHIANAELLPRISELIQGLGFIMPTVCTPEELMGGQHDD